MRKRGSVAARSIEALIFSAAGGSLAWGLLHTQGSTQALWLGGLLTWGTVGWIMGERAAVKTSGSRVDIRSSGVIGEREFSLALEREMGLATRRSAPLALIAIEARNIKAINSEFDRDEGDRAIEAIALASRQCLRETDILARVSGLTFYAILPDSTADAAAAVVARAQNGLGAILRSHPKGEVRVECDVQAFAWDGKRTGSEMMEYIQKKMDGVKRARGK